MTDPADPYTRRALDSFSLRERIEIRLADRSFHFLLRSIGATLKYEVIGGENLDAITAEKRIPIYTFWHDRIFAGTYFFKDRGIVVMTSESKDGEYIARFITRFGYGAIRGSSTRGGSKALVQMIKAMRRGLPMAFTADGPRGPRYVAKPGPLLLAKKTGQPILPFVVEPLSYWTVSSWDRMQIPRPFSRVAVIIGEPIDIDAAADDAEVEFKLKELQDSLNALVERGRDWSREQGRR
jgi:lysophospholipid acyltransferase (LPLAT)-like uncharacterized protein